MIITSLNPPNKHIFCRYTESEFQLLSLIIYMFISNTKLTQVGPGNALSTDGGLERKGNQQYYLCP